MSVGFITSSVTGDTAIAPANAVYDFLKVDGSGSIDMNVDGSGAAVDFEYIVPASTTVLIYRCNFKIQDSNPTATNFGGVTRLTTGCTIKILDSDDSTLFDFTVDRTIKGNDDFLNLAGVDVDIQAGAGTDYVAIRWTWFRGIGAPVQLTAGQKFQFKVQDDITGLTEFHTMLQGKKI